MANRQIMKKIFILTALSAVSILLAQCSPKTAKTTGKPLTKTHDEKLADIKKNFTEADLAEGKTIHDSKCNRCHQLKTITNFSMAEWDNILQRMIPKARLNEQQAALVRAYIMSNTQS
jgi:cytochrome c5